MTEPQEQVRPSNPNVHLESLRLHEMEFKRSGQLWDGTDGDFPINFGIGLLRLAVDKLGLEITVSLEHPEGISASIIYQAVFARPEDPPVSEDEMVAYWQVVAARTAPIIIFPYVREAFSSIALKAGLAHTTLPIMNVGGIFSPEEIEIPSPPDPENAELPEHEG